MKTLKLVNLNVGIKISNTDGVVEFLRQQNADFIALQEITRHLEDSVLPEYRIDADVLSGLGALYPHAFFGPVWVADGFRHNGVVDRDFGGQIEQGYELLAKYPIVGGSNEFFYKSFEYMYDWSNWRQEDHGRSVQIAEFMVDGVPLQILNLHGIWTSHKKGDERTLKECEYIVAAAKRKDIATIITGDFNLSPETPSIQIVDRVFRNLVTEYGVTVTRPDFTDELEGGGNVIDYIFVNNKVEVAHFEVIKSDVSDHYPLALEFSLN